MTLYSLASGVCIAKFSDFEKDAFAIESRFEKNDSAAAFLR